MKGDGVCPLFGGDRAGNSNNTAVMEPCPTDAITGDYTSTTCMANWANWQVYVAESVNAPDASPIFSQMVATDHVNHRGTISTGGLMENANRNMGNFFQVTFDPQHCINLVFSDDHLFDDANATNYDDPSARRKVRAYFTRAVAPAAGIVTTGSCAGTPPPTGGVQVLGGGKLGNATFGITMHTAPMNGALTFKDSDANLDLKSSNGPDSVNASGSCGTMTGAAKVNGNLGYRYTVNACDNGEPGVNKDYFSISVTGPNFSYQKQGSISQGNIASGSQ